MAGLKYLIIALNAVLSHSLLAEKNFLFANTPSGARSSAILFSIFETAKENGLDPYRYLTWVLKTAPALSMTDPVQVDTLLPANAPIDCRVASSI